MNKLNTFIICVIIGGTIAMPYLQNANRKRRQIDVAIDGAAGQISTNEQSISQPEKVILQIAPINGQNAAQLNDKLIIDEIDYKQRDVSDMDVAETHIFRPLFRYRGQLEQRRRVRQG